MYLACRRQRLRVLVDLDDHETFDADCPEVLAMAEQHDQIERQQRERDPDQRNCCRRWSTSDSSDTTTTDASQWPLRRTRQDQFRNEFSPRSS